MPNFVGLGAPRKVYGCTIKNDSENNVKVRISYEGVSKEEENIYDEIIQMNIPANGTFRVDQRTVDKGSYQIRETIQSIQAIRSDGQKQQITAPFEGVVGPELDWLFVIRNSKIESVQRNS